MSGYTHCRGCGKALEVPQDRRDGLCSDEMHDDTCFVEWMRGISQVEFDVAMATPLDSRERAVSIDGWLAATR